MGELANLLRWRKSVDIVDESGEVLQTVYMRVLGDFDIQEAYKQGRIKSAEARAYLRDPSTDEYKELVEPIDDSNKEDCISIITGARSANWGAEAASVVVRPDEVQISEVAIDPDAPTLEEQEKLDAENRRVDLEYEKKLTEYIETKTAELAAELSLKPLKELRALAKDEISNLVPLSAFLREVQDQKIFRSVYVDANYKIRGYDTIQEFREAHPFIKEQLAEAYSNLEIGPDDLKN